MFGLRSYVSLPVQFQDHAKGNHGYIQMQALVPRPWWAYPFNDPDIITRIITAITTPTAPASATTTTTTTTTTTGTPTRATRGYTIPVIAEAGCAVSKVLLGTATLRHLVYRIIGTATVECEDLTWKSSHKRPKFYPCLIIQVILNRLKWLSLSKVFCVHRNAVVTALKKHGIIPTVALNKQFSTLDNVLSTIACFNSVSETVILFSFIKLNLPLLSISHRQRCFEWGTFWWKMKK